MSLTLKQFLSQVDINYRQQMASIPLFDREQTVGWDWRRKKYFAAVFYHLRGHFIDFMWYLANFSSSDGIKKLVLQNISEEFGVGNRLSHEKLYDCFAKECGVNIHDEIVNETHYLPFAKKFNKKHLRWLAEHDIDERLATFAAYERLDNIDYFYLSTFAESLNLTENVITFFKVHVHLAHFESLLENLRTIWQTSPEKVELSFNFIYSHQQRMWRQLSDAVFSLDPNQF